MKASSERRTFKTPALEVGEAYYYILTAEVVRDGAKQTQTKRIVVRAGETATAAFTDMDRVPSTKTSIASGN